MFDFFKRDKKTKNGKAEEEKKSVGNTKISYEPHLISEFEDEHKHLVDRFLKLEKAATRSDPEEIRTALSAFAKLLRAHLLKENLKLYVYLRHATLNDSANGQIVREYQTEMQGIGKAVNDFVGRYKEATFTSDELNTMRAELSEIKSILIERIENEEQVLYPLYMTPESYS